MQGHKYLLFLLFVIIPLFVFSSPVKATQDQDSAEDALLQALEATAQELSPTGSVESTVNDYGIKVWGIRTNPADYGYVIVWDYESEEAARKEMASDQQEYEGYQTTFHDLPAIHFDVEWYNILRVHYDQYIWQTQMQPVHLSLTELEIAEIFYRHALESGFINGDPNQTEKTPTVQAQKTIRLQAQAENYESVTQAIDNQSHLGTVEISGQVTDAGTGAPLAGAAVDIIGGANPGSTVTDSGGNYRLTARVPGGQNSGTASEVNFALPAQANLSIEVLPANTELLADGLSTTKVTIQVQDLNGKPLKDREISLSLDGDPGPGTIQPAQATTNQKGLIQATYTSFKPAPGPEPSNTRHEITVSARDKTTGLSSSASVFVSQYQITVLNEEHLPACTQCDFPAEITVSVTDYWLNPIPNVPLTFQIGGGKTDGSLVADRQSTANQQTLSLTTDDQGRATAYYRWQGSADTTDSIQQVVILDQTTHVEAIREINVHGLDIAIAQVKEVGFTGVTGQQAYFKIYFKDLAHPDLPLNRFNARSPNKLGLRVIIQQYHSDGEQQSLTFEETGGWDEDEGGTFVKMYATPHMPYITPVNDGSSWYEVRVDPVIDEDVFLPDLYRPNNDTIFAVTTGSPEGWLHIWLQDGILTPHTWSGVLFKCVGRFLPVLGDAMTVIDTLNQAYKLDALGLGQSTATVITEQLQQKSDFNSLTKYKAGTINNVISCLQDSYAVYNQAPQGSFGSDEVCAAFFFAPPHLTSPSARLNPHIPEISDSIDRFVQGMLLDTPQDQAIVISGVDSSQVVLHDASGTLVDDPNRMSLTGDVAVYILPVQEQFQLTIREDQAFEISLYAASSSADNRKTIHHTVQSESVLTARMDLGGSSDHTLQLDQDNDGSFETSRPAQPALMDVVKPEITAVSPASGASLSASGAAISVQYADNPGGSGIDPQHIQISVDGANRTAQAEVNKHTLSLPLSDLEPGEHTARIVVSDREGNARVQEWTFTLEKGFSFSLTYNMLLFGGGGLLLLIFLIILVSAAFRSRKKRHASPVRGQPKAIQDKQGQWWYQDPASSQWFLWKGNTWQPVTRGAAPAPTSSQRSGKKPGSSSCLLTLLVTLVLTLVISGGISLIAFQFFPSYQLPRGQGDLNEILTWGGGGILVSILGIFFIRGGFKSILTRRAVGEDDWGRRTEKRGCRAVLDGIIRVSFGVLLLGGGLGAISLTFYQEVLPWLGF